MSNERQDQHAKKLYRKPQFTRKPLAECAAFLSGKIEGSERPSELADPMQEGPILVIEGYQESLHRALKALERLGLCVKPISLDSEGSSIEVDFSGKASSSGRSPLLLLDLRRVSGENHKPIVYLVRHLRLQRAPAAILVHTVEDARQLTLRDLQRYWRMQGCAKAETLARACKSLLQLSRSDDEFISAGGRDRSDPPRTK